MGHTQGVNRKIKHATLGNQDIKRKINPVIEMRRMIVLELWAFKQLNSRQIVEELQRDEYKQLWYERDGKTVKPSQSNVTSDLAAIKKRWAVQQQESYTFGVNKVLYKLNKVQRECAASGDWTTYLSAVQKEIDILGLQAPKNIRIIQDAVTKQLEQAMARLHGQFAHNPVLLHQIIQAIQGNDIDRHELMNALEDAKVIDMDESTES